MVRIDVPTMDWSSAARNMPRSRPDRIVRTWAWVYSPDSGPVPGVGSGALVRAAVVVAKKICLVVVR